MSRRVIEKKPPGALEIVYRILLAVVLVLALILAAGSIYALIRGPRPEAETETVSGETVFTGIGQLRVRTGGEKASTVIVSIAMPWPAEDTGFSGEIAARARGFREDAERYFRDTTVQALRERGEDTVKSDLLVLFNKDLRLGQIEKLYFSDYMIIE